MIVLGAVQTCTIVPTHIAYIPLKMVLNPVFCPLRNLPDYKMTLDSLSSTEIVLSMKEFFKYNRSSGMSDMLWIEIGY